MFQLPSDKRKFSQPNTGETAGNIYASFGIDLDANRGLLRTSEKVEKAITDADNVDLDGYAAAFIKYGTTTPVIFAVSDKVFSATDVTGTWSEETVGTEPNSGNTIMDAAFFDGLALVSEAADIKSWNGSTWASWWQSTKGQDPLNSGQRHLLEVGPDNNLYIVDSGNLVYRVAGVGGGVSKTGNGTLDFSDTNYQLETLVSSSNRMWISGRNKSGGENVIIEWDMSPASATANKLHRIGSSPARCIAIWNDTPIALLQNGRILYFNGVRFEEWEGVQMPVPNGQILSDDFVHPNGWSIIDSLPHFLLAPRLLGNSALTTAKQTPYQMPAGVYCLDPEFGFYHRFSIGTGTTDDYAQPAILQVGALFGLQETTSKFVCSYEYRLPDDSANRTIIAYHDKANSNAARSHVITPMLTSTAALWQMLEMFHKQLTSGERMRVFYRTSNDDPVLFDGVWFDGNTANMVGTGMGIEVGDITFVKLGDGGGQWLKITDVSESATITSITLESSIGTAGELAVFDVLKFRFIGDVTGTTKDSHDFSIPMIKKRKAQFLLTFEPIAESTIEVDNVIIS